MSFLIQPHVRLQEWVAEEHGYFREAGLRFITALRLAAMAPSLGGVETLVLHPASTSHRQLDAAGLSAAGIGEGSIRVSVGLEHPEDLWADFQQALAALPA